MASLSFSPLNPLNYSLGELKKALYGGAVGALLVLGTVLSTSGVPQTAGGWEALGSTLLGSFVVSAVSVFLPKNKKPPEEEGPKTPVAVVGTTFDLGGVIKATYGAYNTLNGQPPVPPTGENEVGSGGA